MGYYVCQEVPSIWVSSLNFDLPQNGSVSESLTHTSRHRLVKSTPGPLLQCVQVPGAAAAAAATLIILFIQNLVSSG